MQPELLVCDEAVAALDVSIQAQLPNLFMNAAARLPFPSALPAGHAALQGGGAGAATDCAGPAGGLPLERRCLTVAA